MARVPGAQTFRPFSRPPYFPEKVQTSPKFIKIGYLGKPGNQFRKGIQVQLDSFPSIGRKHTRNISIFGQALCAPCVKHVLPYTLFKVRYTVRLAITHRFPEALAAGHFCGRLWTHHIEPHKAPRSPANTGETGYFCEGEKRRGDLPSSFLSRSMHRGDLRSAVISRLIDRPMRLSGPHHSQSGQPLPSFYICQITRVLPLR